MTGIPAFNFPMFDAVSCAWRAAGNVAVSPADHDRAVGVVPGDSSRYKELLAWDIAQVAGECEVIVMLPDWENSPGARAERFVAEACGKAVYLAMWRYSGWQFFLDPEQKRMNCVLMSRFGGVPRAGQDEPGLDELLSQVRESPRPITRSPW